MCARVVSPCFCSLEVPSQPPDVWKTRSLFLRLMLWAKYLTFFTGRLGLCFSLLCVQHPGGGRLPRMVSRYLSVAPANTSPVGPLVPGDQGVPLLCIATHLSKAARREGEGPSERQQKNVLTAYALGLQQHSGRMPLLYTRASSGQAGGTVASARSSRF